ncbi:response regulator transcription factor [Rasiella rasia]|uniref:Response regulator transcription factor n=1 Tax=Rasiella rasia TaxID=2744027 RepID=A0A6G6GP53_9FLAO|nr:response regulator transcription factor [Rasiella rasia]QIE60213.1 response regulator transcription factor [Rasiella rasia]
MKKIYRIAVLDDHALIPEAIRALLTGQEKYQYTQGFKSSEALIEYLNNDNFIDVLLLDIQLDGEDGIHLCENLHGKFSDITIIMLSSNTQSAIVMDALKKGAKGFLPKNIDDITLIEALDETLSGKTYIHKEISLIPTITKTSQFDYIPKLTRREREVLKLILEEMTTSEIALTLHISASTVESHRASLFSKTGSKNVVGLIKFTLEKGLLSA